MPSPTFARSLRASLDRLVSGAGLIARALATPMPRADVEQRLAALRLDGLPIEQPVELFWNEHLVPFIEAGTDGDLAFTIGYLQGHLRAGHVAMMKRIARGRLSEALGPAAFPIDRLIRTIDFGRAAAANAAALPAETHAWVQRYCDGLNHWFATVERLPHDVRVLALQDERFTVEDVIAMGRVAGNDINWVGWARLLRHRGEPAWPSIWAEALRYGGNSRASGEDAPDPVEERGGALLEGVARSGSNAVAVAGRRSASGGALLAGDPHVGIFLPPLWLIMGLRSPSYHAVGLMIPGVPFLAIGRNATIGWGATNMRAASSDLVDVSGLAADAFEERVETVAVRWAAPRTLIVRTTPFGPVVNGTPLLADPDAPPVALRWTGHDVSDEISALLQVTRAGDFAAFKDALASFGSSGQNYLYADREGHIGQVMAVHLPDRPPAPPADPVLPPEAMEGWERRLTARELPSTYDPPSGFLASANNQAAPARTLIGYAFAAEDRITRLRQILAGRQVWDMAALAATQRDVVRLSALRLVREVRRLLGDAAMAAGPLAPLIDWQGGYEADAREPVLLERLATALADGMQPPLGALRASEAVLDVLADRLEAMPQAAARDLLAGAAASVTEATGGQRWGDLHHLRLAHVLANLPLVGRRYPQAEPPIGGSTTTVMKTAHDLVKGRHGVRFGANARHVFDMGDPDASWFVILGGQDGDVGARHATDQLPLWLDGRYIRVPLRPETVRAEFKRHMVLQPAARARKPASQPSQAAIR